MGETCGRLFRNYAALGALLIATVATGGAALPSAVANIYGGMLNIERVKIRYNELKSQRLSNEEVDAGTIMFAAQIGLLWGAGNIYGNAISQKIISNPVTKVAKQLEGGIKSPLSPIY